MAVALPDAGALRSTPGLVALGLAGAALLATGAAGLLSAAWGYGLFLTSALLLGLGVAFFATLVLTSMGDTATLWRRASGLLIAGAVAYVLAVFALAGHYGFETLNGRMEWHWILFGPAALAALVVLDVGLYRKLVKNNLPTWRRYRQYISREASDPAAMRKSLLDEVVVHRTLFHASRLRWLRHTLIFWGFVGMFAVELAAVLLREGFPAFGWRDIWREPGHPVRLTFDFLFDLTGLSMLLGCLLALVWRAMSEVAATFIKRSPTVLPATMP